MRRKPAPMDCRATIDSIKDAQCNVRKSRRLNEEHISAVELREHEQRHLQKAQEHYGTEKGALHAYRAGKCQEMYGDYFDLKPETLGAGGEFLPKDIEDGELAAETRPDGELFLLNGLRKEMSDTDVVARTASRHRLEALCKADAFALGIDMAESVGASDSMEKALAHQMAVAHAMSLRFASKANLMLSAASEWHPEQRIFVQGTQAVKMAGASAQLMKASARAAEALHKLRGGSPQQIIVQYVNVGDGGQALVNGNANVGGRGRQK